MLRAVPMSACSAGGNKFRQRRLGQRPAVQIPLVFAAAGTGNEGQLFRRLHPFSEHRQPERLAQRQDGVGNGRALLAAECVAHKTLVDLQFVHWQALQVGQ